MFQNERGIKMNVKTALKVLGYVGGWGLLFAAMLKADEAAEHVGKQAEELKRRMQNNK